jgi:two-component system KDP operon response regulator KdpE
LSAGRIIVIDDQPKIRRFMRATLVAEGYEVDEAKTGEEALETIRESRPDLAVLDMNMPGMGGLATCRAIRKDTDIAIIMLTVRNSEEDKVAALDAGADDFVTKPFSTPELMARIRAALRRVPSAQSSPTKVRVGEIVIDFDERTVLRENVSTHRELLQAVWGPDYGDQVDYLRVFVKNLRKKMETNPEHPQYITTEPWVGYRLKGNVESL